MPQIALLPARPEISSASLSLSLSLSLSILLSFVTHVRGSCPDSMSHIPPFGDACTRSFLESPFSTAQTPSNKLPTFFPFSKVLLMAGADPDLPDWDHYTPLHYAAYIGGPRHAAIARALIRCATYRLFVSFFGVTSHLVARRCWVFWGLWRCAGILRGES